MTAIQIRANKTCLDGILFWFAKLFILHSIKYDETSLSLIILGIQMIQCQTFVKNERRLYINQIYLFEPNWWDSIMSAI